MRYRCVGCGRAFTHYPQGVDRNGCSVRLSAAIALMWALGLSRRSERYVERLGAKVVVTDDLSTYKSVVERAGLRASGMCYACEEERG